MLVVERNFRRIAVEGQKILLHEFYTLYYVLVSFYQYQHYHLDSYVL